MKPRDRRQFAAVVRAETPATRRAAVVQVLMRLGSWRGQRVGSVHLAPIEMLADAVTGARMQGEQLIISLTHGRLILEAGAAWETQTDGQQDLAVLFRRIRLDWHGRTLSITPEGRPDPAGGSALVFLRSPLGRVIELTPGRFWWQGDDGEVQVEPIQPVRGRYVLDWLARMLAWHPPIESSPALMAVQAEDDGDAWAIYADWLHTQGDGRVEGSASPLLARWMATVETDALRWSLTWHAGHIIDARLDASQGPDLKSLVCAVVNGPAGVALRHLHIESQGVSSWFVWCIADRPQPALRSLRWTHTWDARPPLPAQPLLDACPRLTQLQLPEGLLTQALRSSCLRALAFFGCQPDASGTWHLPAVEHLDVGSLAPLSLLHDRIALPRLRWLVLRGWTLDDTPAWHGLFERLTCFNAVHCRVADGLARWLDGRFGSQWRAVASDSVAFWDV